jgi:hypothetical protein
MNKEKKIVKDIKSFVVNRKNWYRGKGMRHSRLLNNANNMCCLGFYALACGLDKKVIRNIQDPLNAVRITESNPKAMDSQYRNVLRKSEVIWNTKLVPKNREDNSVLARKLMTVNDEKELSEEKREETLTKLFKKMGVEVKFK